jgi:hypothetical protein
MQAASGWLCLATGAAVNRFISVEADRYHPRNELSSTLVVPAQSNLVT